MGMPVRLYGVRFLLLAENLRAWKLSSPLPNAGRLLLLCAYGLSVGIHLATVAVWLAERTGRAGWCFACSFPNWECSSSSCDYSFSSCTRFSSGCEHSFLSCGCSSFELLTPFFALWLLFSMSWSFFHPVSFILKVFACLDGDFYVKVGSVSAGRLPLLATRWNGQYFLYKNVRGYLRRVFGCKESKISRKMPF